MASPNKVAMIDPARRLTAMGFLLVATAGTAGVLREGGVEVEAIKKLAQGRPNVLDFLTNGDIQFIFNTPSGKGARTDEGKIRAAAVAHGVPCVTTVPGCLAVVRALEAMVENPVPRVRALQDWMQAVAAQASGGK